MTSTDVAERDVIELVLPRYRDEGYEVYVHPSPSLLPPFMKSYQPDAIALRDGRKIAIEVVRGDEASRKAESLHSLFAEQDDWELQIIYAPPLSSRSNLLIASRPIILESIRRVDALREAGDRLPSLMMAWATFEAIGRALLPTQLGQPQSPARLVEVLASEGIITPDEAQVLRRASAIRNAVAHGAIDAVVDDELLQQVIAILSTLAEMAPAEALS
ncbi:MAG: hypothetical protein HZA66_03765 [Rhodopseudomonas palustris]|uniref:REase AHJR-like domain-containing protein n=1 Tax=Rhodopseudomonas palustris TaxID=1076 RepID=A0A933RUL4_RHOPL|nr:hypothetical protein [Rhodopseudomonas palustris]